MPCLCCEIIVDAGLLRDIARCRGACVHKGETASQAGAERQIALQQSAAASCVTTCLLT